MKRLGLVALLLLASCFAERRGLSRDALLKSLEQTTRASDTPTLDEIQALRVPPAPATLKPGDAKVHPCLSSSIKRDYDALLKECSEFLDRSPGDARAPAAVRQLTRAATAVPRALEIIAAKGASWIDGCAKAKSACADLAWIVNEERAAFAVTQKHRAQFAEVMKASGRLMKARVEGPYAGDAIVAMARDRNGEKLVELAPYFHVVELASADGRFAPAARGKDGVYRFTMVASGGGRGTLFLTSSNIARVRIDGTIIAERNPEDEPPSVVRAGVELSRGTHVVEVLALSTGRNDRISVALLDDAGRPLLTAGGGAANASAKVVPLKGAVEALAYDVEDVSALIWRHALARNPSVGVSPDEGRRIVVDLVARHGANPFALAVAAEALGDDGSVPERMSSNAAASMWQRVRTVWPDHPVARISEARDLREERPDEALRAYRALVKAQPKYAHGHRELIELLLEDGVVDEARASAEAVLALGESADSLSAAANAFRQSGDHARAAALEAKHATLEPDWSGTRYARRLIDSGERAEATNFLEDAIALGANGAALDLYLDTLSSLDPDLALSESGKYAARYPNDETIALRLVRLTWSLKGKDAARNMVSQVLPRFRLSSSVQALADELGIDPPWLARLALGDRVIAERRALQAEPFPGYAAVALLDDVERHLWEDESSTVIRHLVIELKSKEVLDRFGEIGTGSAKLLRLRVVKPDGTVVEPDRHGGVDDVSLPDLAIGDVVELLTVENDDAPLFHGSFETRELDGLPTPALMRRYFVSFSKGFDEQRNAKIIATNGAKVMREERDGRVTLSFAERNAPALLAEPASPDRAETSRNAGFAWGVDDELWALLRGMRVERSAKKGFWIQRSAERIASGRTPEEKLQQIFAFVVNRIEPADSPDDARTVLSTGRGTRTALFVALARAAGLDAAPVALHLVTQPPLEIPDTGAFSVIGARVRIGDRAHYAIVDGNAVLDALPPVARGALVLDVSKDARERRVEVLPDDVIDMTPVRMQVDLGPDDNGLSGLVVVTIPPGKADGARRGVRRATADQLKQILERSLVDSLPGIRVTDVKIPGIDDAGAALTIGARVQVPLSSDSTDGTTRFEHLFARGATGGLQLSVPPTAYLSVADRKSPLLVIADAELLEMQIALPKGGVFVEAPESTDLRVGPFVMSQRVEITDGVLFWRRSLSQQNARISVADWPKTYAGLATMAARTDARLSFVVSRRSSTGGISTDLSGERASSAQTR